MKTWMNECVKYSNNQWQLYKNINTHRFWMHKDLGIKYFSCLHNALALSECGLMTIFYSIYSDQLNKQYFCEAWYANINKTQNMTKFPFSSFLAMISVWLDVSLFETKNTTFQLSRFCTINILVNVLTCCLLLQYAHTHTLSNLKKLEVESSKIHVLYPFQVKFPVWWKMS